MTRYCQYKQHVSLQEEPPGTRRAVQCAQRGVAFAPSWGSTWCPYKPGRCMASHPLATTHSILSKLTPQHNAPVSHTSSKNPERFLSDIVDLHTH